MLTQRIGIVFAFLTSGVLAQSPEPSFEVASVKPAATDFFIPMEVGPERFHAATSLFGVIQWAYNIKPYQVSGGPTWLKRDRFDIQAKAESSVSEDQMKKLVRQLLANRFQLKAHLETRETAVYALVVDKNGPKLQAAKDSTQCNGDGCFGVGSGHLTAKGGTMTLTAVVLTQLQDRPALDKTGLTGHYDFSLTYDNSSVKAPMMGMSNAPTDGPSIFAAVQDLGLKLEPQKVPIEVLVIDSVEQPSGN